jgi:hypothetical protein
VLLLSCTLGARLPAAVHDPLWQDEIALACKLLPLWAAALAGLIVSFSGQLVVHGAELRSYAMLALAYVAFAFLLERAVARPGRLRLALLAGVVAVGSLTHYFFLLALATGVLWLVSSVRERAVSLRVGAALAVGLVPLAVWSPYWLQQYQHSHFGPDFTWARLVSFLPVLFAPDVIVREAGRTVQVTVSLAVLGSAVLLLRRPEGRLYAALALLPLLVGWVVWAAGQSGVGNPRNLIEVVPFVAIALSWACASLPWRRVSQAVAVLVGVLVIGGFGRAKDSRAHAVRPHRERGERPGLQSGRATRLLRVLRRSDPGGVVSHVERLSGPVAPTLRCNADRGQLRRGRSGCPEGGRAGMARPASLRHPRRDLDPLLRQRLQRQAGAEGYRHRPAALEQRDP